MPEHSGGALSVCFPKFASIQYFPLFGFSKSWLSAGPCCCSFPIWTTFGFCLPSQLLCVLSPNPFFSLFTSRLYHTRYHHPSSCVLLIPDPADKLLQTSPCSFTTASARGGDASPASSSLWESSSLGLPCTGHEQCRCSCTSVAPGFCQRSSLLSCPAARAQVGTHVKWDGGTKT